MMPTPASADQISWPADVGPSTKWTTYTRGNVGEVYPEIVLPLEWELGGPPSEEGWRVGAETVGFATAEDMGDEPWVITGVFGGYAYFNVGVMRLLGVRTPGMGPELIDQQFLGDADVPAYQPRDGDKNLKATARVVATAVKTLTAKSVPLLDEMRPKVAAHRATAPALDASNEALFGYIVDGLEGGLWAYLIGSHVIITMQATIAAGALADFCEKHLDDPNIALELTTGLGDVVSAEPAKAMWDLANETAAEDYDSAFATFIDKYGHRGPNEFSLNGRDWAAYPELATAAIDTMRGLDPTRSPHVQARRMSESREATVKSVKEKLGWRAARLEKSIANAAMWSRAREESKDLVILANQGSRHRYLELARRAQERGGVEDREGPLLLTRVEFEAYLDDPPSMVPTIDERRAEYDYLAGLEPPFAFDTTGHDGWAPPISTWLPRRTSETGDHAASSGTTLSGAAGSPGTATGKARVVTDPADPRGLEAGDILVAPVTDPSWTPLFVGAGAVIVEIGAAMSHSMIVSRELGIPCVVGVEDATLKIVDGAMVEVDGSTGSVKIL